MECERLEGSCPICNKRATSKCSGCKREFYCTKEHQRKDWARHKFDCQAWEIGENDEVGRHLLAKRDLSAGDVILSESPIVWGPTAYTTDRVCVGCGIKCNDADAWCGRCFWPACKSRCKGLADEHRHGSECLFLVRARIVPRSDLLLVIRVLMLWRSKSKRWDALDRLQSHEGSRGPGTEAYAETRRTAEQLGRLLADDAVASRGVLTRICGLIDVNALETNPPDGSSALYETACLLEHSCLPNTRHGFSLDGRGRPRVTVKAISSIKKGEHISTMYTHALWATRARRAHLLASKYFSCHCKRCGDPTEMGTHLGTLKCPCGNGLILPKNPLDSKTEWSCNTCPGALSGSEVAELTDRLEEDVEEGMKQTNKEALTQLLSRLTALLHPGHQHCIAVTHSLIQLLAPEDPRKSELCKRVIATVTALDPHGARLALYTAVALRELSRCPGEEKKELLKRAATLLELEPAGSPGQKLRALIVPELASLD